MMRLASGDKNIEVATVVDLPIACSRWAVKTWAPVPTSQTRTVESHELETIRPPSGKKATDEIPVSCSRICMTAAPETASQTRMVASAEPEAILVLSEEKT